MAWCDLWRGEMNHRETYGVKAAQAWLAKSSFFKGLPERDCNALAERCRWHHPAKRTVLFVENDAGESLFLLVSGTVQLTKMSREGREVVIRTLKPGEVFAEVVLEGDRRYPVTATAVADCDVLELPRREIFRLLDDERFRDDFIAFLMRKQRYLAERVRYLTMYDVDVRFRHFLKEHFGEKSRIPITLSKKDVASAIGATPETFSRLLNRLAKQDLAHWRRGELALAPEFWSASDGNSAHEM